MVGKFVKKGIFMNAMCLHFLKFLFPDQNGEYELRNTSQFKKMHPLLHLAVVSILVFYAVYFLQEVREAIHKQLLLERLEGKAIRVLLHHSKGGVRLSGLCKVNQSSHRAGLTRVNYKNMLLRSLFIDTTRNLDIMEEEKKEEDIICYTLLFG